MEFIPCTESSWASPAWLRAQKEPLKLPGRLVNTKMFVFDEEDVSMHPELIAPYCKEMSEELKSDMMPVARPVNFDEMELAGLSLLGTTARLESLGFHATKCSLSKIKKQRQLPEGSWGWHSVFEPNVQTKLFTPEQTGVHRLRTTAPAPASRPVPVPVQEPQARPMLTVVRPPAPPAEPAAETATESDTLAPPVLLAVKLIDDAMAFVTNEATNAPTEVPLPCEEPTAANHVAALAEVEVVDKRAVAECTHAKALAKAPVLLLGQ